MCWIRSDRDMLQLQSPTASFFQNKTSSTLGPLVRVMMFREENWVTYLQGAHSFAIICTSWSWIFFAPDLFYTIFLKNAQESCFDLFCFMRFLCHNENLKYTSAACLVNWMETLFTKKNVGKSNVKHQTDSQEPFQQILSYDTVL